MINKSTQEIDFSLIPFNPKFEKNRSSLSDIKIQGTLKLSSEYLTLTFDITGSVQSIQWPKRKLDQARQDNLWKNTCFEFFLKDKKTSIYWEFNFSPDQYFNCYQFDDYRENMQTERRIEQHHSKFEVTADHTAHFSSTVNLKKLIAECSLSTIEIGISCVIQSRDDMISFFALNHCSKQPDFHNKDSFVITMQLE